jgi:hypothetical protein
VRYVVLILLTVFLASGLVVLVDTRTEPVLAASALRGPDQILGAPRYSQATVERYARSIDCSHYIMKTIPIYYRLAPRRSIAPDALVAQSIVETGRGYYGGVSKPWNMAGIKKGGEDRGDAPEDFEVSPPPTKGSGCTSTIWQPTRARDPSASRTTASTTRARPRSSVGGGSGKSAS